MAELSLWFTFEDGFLCVHDLDNHTKNIVLALYQIESKTLRIFLREGTYGYKIIDEIIKKHSAADIANVIQDHYELYGFRLPGN